MAHRTTHIDRLARSLADEVAELPDDRLLTTAQLAAWLGVHIMTIKRWRRHGTGPAYTVTGVKKIRYRKGDVCEWLRSKTVRGERVHS